METTIEVHEASQVGEVRRIAADLARAEDMSETEVGRVSLVATEVCTNLVKYGKHGFVTLSRYAEAQQRGIEIVAVDRGPGFTDFSVSLRDGHSTGGSLGLGLGSIHRASAFFDVYTVADQGTALMARVAKAVPGAKRVAAPLIVSGRSRPKPGQTECGDAWLANLAGTTQSVCIVDGLGHGPLAATAARLAIKVFEAAAPGDSPEQILQQAHLQLKATRGVVMAVLALDAAAGTATFCGVGNIAAVIAGDAASEHLLSTEGIVGYNLRKVRTQQIAWKAGATAVLNTDGVSTRLSLGKYPGLVSHHPSLVASVLFRDYAGQTDDATLVVARGM
ncbi:MAG: ATP-binding protein [Ramlibacter sp.]